ncbi:MAG: twin-arginine translocation signal domain-containing protein [Thermomicrobiales bacterium]|nr:twin-arginine translocation signal domain-containing protein [Thermomicrobiales bacterium]
MRAHTEFHRLVRMSQNRRDFLRMSALTAGLAVSAVPIRALGQGTSTPPAIPETADITLHLPFNAYGQPVTVDPHRSVNWGPFWVMLPYAWSGLLRFDENGAVEADLAESVEPNEDGSVWTATLRDGIAFADGTIITAEHFIDSWHRALDSTALTPMYRYFAPIGGAAERAAGENLALSVTAPDERTLEITLTAPLAHFPSYLATFGYAVVHPKYGATDDPVELVDAASGPWRITEFTDSTIRMTPNPYHWSEKSADIGEIEWRIAPTGGTDAEILQWFQDDAVAVADLPIGILSTLAEDDALRESLHQFDTQSSVYALALDFHQTPFNDVRVRRAFAAAINREQWAADIQLDTYVAANSFTPPVLASIANYEAPTDAFDDDVAALLADAELDPESSEYELMLYQPATEASDAMDRMAQLVTMLQDATGLTITHDTALTAEQITAARQDAGGLQMQLVQWQIDTDVPSLLAIAAQDSDYNAGWFNWEPSLEDSGDYTPGADAATFDEKITAATTELDEEKRNALYAEAETLLLKNAVLIPIGFWNPAYVQKDWLQGTRQGPWSGSTPVRIDAEVTVDREAMPAESTPEA